MTDAFEIREIEYDDLPEVVALLCEGFPSRKAEYWRSGFQRLTNRKLPPEIERYGYVLTAGGALRGVVLTIPSVNEDGTARNVFMNISSWYVQPSFRGRPATELYRHASRRPDVTYTNLSPAVHTIKTIRGLGFQELTSGQMVAVGWRWRRPPSGKIRIASSSELAKIDITTTEVELLKDHDRLGCLTLCVEAPGHISPFIFLRRRVKGFMPCAQLIYCRELTDLTLYGREIAGWLARRGIPFMLIDASKPIEGLVGYFVQGKSPKYFKGPRPMKAIDHTYSEMVFFGF